MNSTAARILHNSEQSRHLWDLNSPKPRLCSASLVRATVAEGNLNCIVLPTAGDTIDLGDRRAAVVHLTTGENRTVELTYITEGPELHRRTLPADAVDAMHTLVAEIAQSDVESTWANLLWELALEHFDYSQRADAFLDSLYDTHANDPQITQALEAHNLAPTRADRYGTATLTLEVSLQAFDVPTRDRLDDHLDLDALSDALRDHLPRHDWNAAGGVVTDLTIRAEELTED